MKSLSKECDWAEILAWRVSLIWNPCLRDVINWIFKRFTENFDQRSFVRSGFKAILISDFHAMISRLFFPPKRSDFDSMISRLFSRAKMTSESDFHTTVSRFFCLSPNCQIVLIFMPLFRYFFEICCSLAFPEKNQKVSLKKPKYFTDTKVEALPDWLLKTKWIIIQNWVEHIKKTFRLKTRSVIFQKLKFVLNWDLNHKHKYLIH